MNKHRLNNELQFEIYFKDISDEQTPQKIEGPNPGMALIIATNEWTCLNEKKCK